MQLDPNSQASAVRWGVLSVANIGVQRVIPAIVASANGQLVGVASRNPERARELFATMPSVRFHSDYESLINDPEVEAIYNPLPNSLHAEWSTRAMQAGKHVLCEKPLAVTAQQGASMARVARENGVLLMEAFMYRFHPQTVWALEQMAAGRIGDVKLVRASFSFNISIPPRPQDIRLQAALAGGSLMDVGCYPVNFCHAVYGHAPVAVAARVYIPTEGEVERSANAVLDFGDGRFGLIDSSFELPSRQVAEILGERDFRGILQQGVHESIYTSLIREHWLLVVAFDKQTHVGLVKVLARRASDELERVLDRVLSGSAEAKEQVVNVQFRSSVENTIDYLFRD